MNKDPLRRPRGELLLRSPSRIRWIRGDTFWAVATDSLEIPWLVRYRLRRADE